MCLAFPARVKSVDEKRIVLDVDGSDREIKRGMLAVKPGDCVIVHANRIVDKLTEKQYKEYLKGLSKL